MNRGICTVACLLCLIAAPSLSSQDKGQTAPATQPKSTPPAAQAATSPADAARLQNAAQHLKDVQQQLQQGFATSLDVERAKWDLKILEAEQSGDHARLAQVRVDAATAILKEVDRRYQLGTVSSLDYERAQWDLKIREAEQSGDQTHLAQVRLAAAIANLRQIEALSRLGSVPNDELIAAQAQVKLRQAELDAIGAASRPATRPAGDSHLGIR